MVLGEESEIEKERVEECRAKEKVVVEVPVQEMLMGEGVVEERRTGELMEMVKAVTVRERTRRA